MPDSLVALIEKVAQEIVVERPPGKLTRLLWTWYDSKGLLKADRQLENELFQVLERYFRPLIAKKLGNPKLHNVEISAVFNDLYVALQKADIPYRWVNSYQFRAMVRTIIDNILKDYIKASGRKKRPQSELKVTIEGVNEPAGTREIDYIECCEALDKLGEINAREKKVVELRIFDGLSVAEVAKVLAISPATVKRDWDQARQHLKILFGERRRPS